jgi:hypothetical protein
LQEAALRLLAREGDSPLVGLARLFLLPDAAKQVSARGVGKIVVFKLAASDDCVNQLQARLRAVPHGDGDGAIQLDNGRG